MSVFFLFLHRIFSPGCVCKFFSFFCPLAHVIFFVLGWYVSFAPQDVNEKKNDHTKIVFATRNPQMWILSFLVLRVHICMSLCYRKNPAFSYFSMQ